MIQYELLDHTADLGVRVYGRDLGGLFINAAYALFDIVAEKTDSETKCKTKSFPIHIEVENKEELFNRWLNELLSLADCEDLVFVEFDIKSLTEQELHATAKGVSRENFIGKTEVKAVTYHNLLVEKANDQYKAEFLMDV